jgi:ADP-heptose:LPS heptosyltransferase
LTTFAAVKILVIQTAFLGDVILATSLLETLHAQVPSAQVDMLVRRGNESLLAGHPFLRRVLIWDKQGGKYRDLRRLLGEVRRERYDAVLNLQRFATMGLFTALSGAGQTVGFDKNPFARFFTHRVPHRIDPGTHEVDRNAALLRPLGLLATPAPPRLYPPAAAYEKVRPLQEVPYGCLAPTSVWPTKQLPESQWVTLLQSLPTDAPLYLLGGPADAPTCERLRQAANRPNVVSLAGQLTLLESAALMEGAVLNYVNDSGPLHLASARNAPTAAVFCSTVPAFGFGPRAAFARVIETPHLLECRPCGLHGRTACPLEHFHCATTIPNEALIAVWQEARSRA